MRRWAGSYICCNASNCGRRAWYRGWAARCQLSWTACCRAGERAGRFCTVCILSCCNGEVTSCSSLAPCLCTGFVRISATCRFCKAENGLPFVAISCTPLSSRSFARRSSKAKSCSWFAVFIIPAEVFPPPPRKPTPHTAPPTPETRCGTCGKAPGSGACRHR